MTIKTETKKLTCVLSEHELLERGDELAKTYMKVAALDMEKKRITSRIKPLDERIEMLVTIIDTKEEERDVDCEWNYDFNLGLKRLRRGDTYEVIDSNEIKDWERQQMLALEPSEKLYEDKTEKPAKIGDLFDQVQGKLAEEPENEPSVCTKADCSHYDAEEPNGCDSTEEVWLCEPCVAAFKAAKVVASICAACVGDCEADGTPRDPSANMTACTGYASELSVNQLAHRNRTCTDSWQDCEHANKCFSPVNEEGVDGPCICIADEIGKGRMAPFPAPLKGAISDQAKVAASAEEPDPEIIFLPSDSFESKGSLDKAFPPMAGLPEKGKIGKVFKHDGRVFHLSVRWWGGGGNTEVNAYEIIPREEWTGETATLEERQGEYYRNIRTTGGCLNSIGCTATLKGAEYVFSKRVTFKPQPVAVSLQEAVTAANTEPPSLSELCAKCHKAAACDDCCKDCNTNCNTQQTCSWPGVTAPENKRVTLEEAREKRAKLIKTAKAPKVKK
jgi:hypothetical protein